MGEIQNRSFQLSFNSSLNPTAGVDCPSSICRRARARNTVRTGCKPPLNNSSSRWRSRRESPRHSLLPMP